MQIDSIRHVLLRDLGALRREIEAYPDDDAPWQQPPGATNAGGTLALHLAGNLQHYVGARLGGTGYVRDRDAEFALRGVKRVEIVRAIDAAVDAVDRTLSRLDAGALARPFPEPIGGCTVETGDFLLHLAAHFAYHLGQIDYHRRVVTGDRRAADAMAVRELRSARPAG